MENQAGREGERGEEQLRARIVELEAELTRYRREEELRRNAAGVAGRAAVTVLGAKEIETALDEWEDAYKRTGRIPGEESRHVVYAVMKRLLRTRFRWVVAALMGALISSGILTIQTVLMSRQTELMDGQTGLLAAQNTLLEGQNRYFEKQIEFMQRQDWVARRAQLLAIIYDEDCSLPMNKETNGRERCQMKASSRARTDAVRAFVELEQITGESGANLENSRLDYLSFYRADLRHVNFSKAELQHASLQGADLRGAILFAANLSHARLNTVYEQQNRMAIPQITDLRGATLNLADLRGADLTHARLADAEFRAADLRGANLYGADITNTIFQAAKFSSDTQWPKGFDPVAAGAILMDDQGKPHRVEGAAKKVRLDLD